MIEILCAPVGCGKSTYSKGRAEEGALIVNDDSIVMLVHGGNYKLYEKNLKPLYKLVENQILTTGMLMNRDIIIDRPNFSRDTRSRYISLARSFDIPIICTLWPWTTAEDSAKMRFNKNNRGYPYEYWLEVAKAHYSKYEEPSIEEGIGYIRKMT